MSVRIPISPAPSPGERYDSENEAQFRRGVEDSIRMLADAIGAVPDPEPPDPPEPPEGLWELVATTTLTTATATILFSSLAGAGWDYYVVGNAFPVTTNRPLGVRVNAATAGYVGMSVSKDNAPSIQWSDWGSIALLGNATNLANTTHGRRFVCHLIQNAPAGAVMIDGHVISVGTGSPRRDWGKGAYTTTNAVTAISVLFDSGNVAANSTAALYRRKVPTAAP